MTNVIELLDALDAARDRKRCGVEEMTITLAAGHYELPQRIIIESIRALTLQAETPGSVVLDGQETRRIMSVQEEADVTLIGLNLTRGFRDSSYTTGGGGGCVRVTDASNLTMRECSVSRCRVGITMTSTAAYGGGVYVSSGSMLHMADCRLTDNAVSGPRRTSLRFRPVRQGGALYLWDAYARIERCTFVGNSADRGGAIYVSNGSAIEMKDSVLDNNTGSNFDSEGCALYFDSRALAKGYSTLAHNTFRVGPTGECKASSILAAMVRVSFICELGRYSARLPLPPSAARF